MRSDCITSRMLKIVLSHYLQYEAKVIAHAFPAGTTQCRHKKIAGKSSFAGVFVKKKLSLGIFQAAYL
jgi:hypothetical protein